MLKHLKSARSKNIKEVFLIEALGHASAVKIESPKGKIFLRKGALITPRTVSDLAARGIDRVQVYDKPRISIIVIGREFASPGVALLPGKVYDFSSLALKAALESMRIRPVFVRQIPGKSGALKEIIPFAINQSDMIILVIKEIEQGLTQVTRLLKDVRDGAVFIKKGSGLKVLKTFISQGKKPIFCLPYDPDVIFKRFDNLIQPAIMAFMGCANSKDPYVA